MWIFTNTLQLIYYLSVVNVNFPDIVNVFFPYIQICNANNKYVSESIVFDDSIKQIRDLETLLLDKLHFMQTVLIKFLGSFL